MGENISITISAKENYTSAIATIRNANKVFQKDLEGTQRKLDAINRGRATLQVDVSQAKAALGDAEQQFAKTGDAANRLAWELAQANYDGAQNNLGLLTQQAQKAEEQILKLSDVSGPKGKLGAALGTLNKSGALGELVDFAGDALVTYQGSVAGNEGAIMTQNTIDGAVKGATIGNIIFPGVGAAIGTLIGAGVGHLRGEQAIFELEDDVFKAVVQEKFTTEMANQAAALERGIAIAASSQQALRQMEGDLGGGAATYLELENTLQQLQQRQEGAMGQGYIEVRTPNLENQIAAMEGPLGEAQEKANQLVGQWQASLDNQRDQTKLDMEQAVMLGTPTDAYGEEIQIKLAQMHEEYNALMASGKEEDGARMGALLAEARVMAENEYMASEGAQLEIATQKSLVEAIRTDTNLKEEYWKTGYEMQQEFSKGQEAAGAFVMVTTQFRSSGSAADERYNEYLKTHASDTWGINEATYQPDLTDKRQLDSCFAMGLARVPYDNFPARLHEGERVLTASEARQYRQGGPSVQISGTFHIREEADVQRVAAQIVQRLARAQAVT